MSHPIGHYLKKFIENVDDNPRVQLKIHTIGFWYWTINFPAVTFLFFFEPTLWTKWGLFITLVYSIYANFTSDYTGMSSSQAVINTTKIDITESELTVNE